MKTVRIAMIKGGAEFQRQKVLNRAAGNWNQRIKEWHESDK